MAEVPNNKQRVTIEYGKVPGEEKPYFTLRSNSAAGLIDAIIFIIVNIAKNWGVTIVGLLLEVVQEMYEKGLIDGSDRNTLGSLQQELSDSNS